MKLCFENARYSGEAVLPNSGCFSIACGAEGGPHWSGTEIGWYSIPGKAYPNFLFKFKVCASVSMRVPAQFRIALSERRSNLE
jgi:hypothetical protein